MTRATTRPAPHALAPALLTLAVIALVIALATLAGCDDRGASNAPPPPGAKPGRLIGKLADARGNPLSNVTISIYGFSDAGEAVNKRVVIPGPASAYDIELPDGVYNTPVARVALDYRDRWYDLPLAAADGTREWTEQKHSRRGLVRDWVWKINGPSPSGTKNTPDGYWGGSIHFDKKGEIGDYANVEIALTPDGPLIDGSEGETIVFTRAIPWVRPDDHYLFDVPIGRYIATAKQLFGARPKPLRVSAYNIDPTDPDASELGGTSIIAPVDFQCVEVKPGEWKMLVPNLVAFPPK